MNNIQLRILSFLDFLLLGNHYFYELFHGKIDYFEHMKFVYYFYFLELNNMNMDFF